MENQTSTPNTMSKVTLIIGIIVMSAVIGGMIARAIMGG